MRTCNQYTIGLDYGTISIRACIVNVANGAEAAAVVAGAHGNYATAQKAMTGLKPKVNKSDPKAHAVYRELCSIYKEMHDAFGTRE